MAEYPLLFQLQLFQNSFKQFNIQSSLALNLTKENKKGANAPFNIIYMQIIYRNTLIHTFQPAYLKALDIHHALA